MAAQYKFALFQGLLESSLREGTAMQRRRQVGEELVWCGPFHLGPIALDGPCLPLCTSTSLRELGGVPS